MKKNYEYDDSGLASSYLVLAILLPSTLYLSYNKLFSTKKIGRYICSCERCLKKPYKKNKNSFILLVLISFWVLISLLIKNVLTLKLEYKSEYFNPYKVLEVGEEDSDNAIKKAFRKKAVKFNPDVVPEEEKEQVISKLKEVIKAFNILKDKKGKTFVNEMTYEVVAIPKFIIEKGYLVLIFYGVLLGLYFPNWAFKKWSSSVSQNKYGVYYSTIDSFYCNVLEDTKDLNFIIQFIVGSKDLKERKWKSKDLRFLKQYVEDKFGFPLKDFGKPNQPYFVFIDHIFRMGKADYDDLDFLQVKSIAIINSLKEVAICKNFINTLKNLFEVEKMIVQAVFDPEFYLMQLPGNVFEKIFLKNKKVKDFIPEKDNILPKISIKKLDAYVENADLPEVASEYKENTQNVYFVPRNSKITVRVQLDKPEDEFVHAPFLVRNLKLYWSILLVFDDKIVEEMVSIPNKSEINEAKFFLDSCDDKVQSKVTVFLKTGCYFNLDQKLNIVLKYSK